MPRGQVGITRDLKLKSGLRITLILSHNNVLTLPSDERALVFAIADMMQAYEQGQKKDEPDGVAVTLSRVK